MSSTERALANITDAGLFERLATAVLREATPAYHSLVHPGVNVNGKTVKSPLDGICYIQGSNPPHMVAVHHTIADRDDLINKWLHDPSTVRPRKGKKPTAPAGDLIKTSELVKKERTHTPGLLATLILTTNEEPREGLVRAVNEAGHDRGLNIDIWSRSRLSHFLDNQPTGQWLRHSYLGIDQEQLSAELLLDLSQKSAESHCPMDNPSAWIPRDLDVTLNSRLSHQGTFLVAKSGLGKSVACYRMITEHIASGGAGIFLPHNVVSSSVTLEQAVTTALNQLHPPLVMGGEMALTFCSPEQPLVLVVEDINRSGQGQLLAEKIAGWCRPSKADNAGTSSNWHLICPLWPEVLSTIGEQARKQIAPLTIVASGFTESEGTEAVQARSRLDGHELSVLSAKAVSSALGHDPLLISLHDQKTAPEPHHIIGQFVERVLTSIATETKTHSTTDYRRALRNLAGEMLDNRQIELNWCEIRCWAELQKDGDLSLISHLAHHGELIRYAGASGDQIILFRHDRVRDWLLVDAVDERNRQEFLTDEVVAEPFFAEVMGAVLTWGQPNASLLQRVSTTNPLALFHALRITDQTNVAHHEIILQTINDWLDKPTTHDSCNQQLRWEMLAMLSETDSPKVPGLVCKFQERTTNGMLARLRNADVLGGVEICIGLEPGVGAPWRDHQIEHAKLHHGHVLTKDLEIFLRREDLHRSERVGALRMAGHLAAPELAQAIEVCWTIDEEREVHLADYLWAFGQCCTSDPERFLDPVCNTWASLPDKSEEKGMPSLRDEVAAHQLRWAFHRWPPVDAIDYFIQRASQEDLKWPITYMLHEMDDPKAVVFVALELAEMQRRLEGSNSISPFAMNAGGDWERKQEQQGCPMSQVSREHLYDLWKEETNEIHLRTQAFKLWAATKHVDDIELLRTMSPTVELEDMVLRARLTRGDQQAIPAMIEKLASKNGDFWWQQGRHVWSAELTETLDEELGRHAKQEEQTWGKNLEGDWITSELIMRLPVDDAERLLLKHWDHLRFRPNFVQAALYVSTKQLLKVADVAIEDCPEPTELFKHLSMHYGIKGKGRSSLLREAKILTLAPYLNFLSPTDIWFLWEECNNRGWFSTRQKLLDDLLPSTNNDRIWNRDHAATWLDKMIEEKRTDRIHYWIDKYLETGVPWLEILAVMTTWLDQRRSIEAFKVTADAIKYHGTRADLGSLKFYKDMPELTVLSLLSDTQFAVRRRSLH